MLPDLSDNKNIIYNNESLGLLVLIKLKICMHLSTKKTKKHALKICSKKIIIWQKIYKNWLFTS